MNRGRWVGGLDSCNWCMSEGIWPSTQGELGRASGCCECPPHWWALGGGWALEKQQQLSSWPCLAASRKSSQYFKHHIKYQTPCSELQLEVSSLNKTSIMCLVCFISSHSLDFDRCPALSFYSCVFTSWGWQNGGARKSALCHAEQLMTWVERCVHACVHAWMGYTCVVTALLTVGAQKGVEEGPCHSATCCIESQRQLNAKLRRIFPHWVPSPDWPFFSFLELLVTYPSRPKD